MVKVEVTPRPIDRPTCAFCRAEVEDAPGRCPSCETAFHEECRQELARCPTPGCAGFSRPRSLAERRGSEAAERAAQREAARARREAEAQAGRVALPPPRQADTAHPLLQLARGRDLVRPTPVQLVKMLAAIALGVPLLLSAVVALTQPHALTAEMVPWLLGVTGYLLAQVLLVSLVGVRRTPLIRLGSKGAGTPHLFLTLSAIWLGSSALPDAPLVGGIAGGLIGLALALRWLGFLDH